MFRKLLNVGKGHSNDKLQQQQQQQKSLFQLNEIRSYGFSHLCCLGYSSSLSLLAVGSKYGLLRVLGNSSVEFSYQLESGNSIRQIEFIDCRNEADNKQKTAISDDGQQTTATDTFDTSAKIVVLTDNGQLHLFELKTFKQQNFADNTTQTDAIAVSDCCQPTNQLQQHLTGGQQATKYTKLESAAQLDYFKHKLDDEDRSKRVTTLEISADGLTVFVGTEGGYLYLIPLDKFEKIDSLNEQQQQVQANQQVRPASANGSKQEEVAPKTTVKSASGGNVVGTSNENEAAKEDETTVVNLSDEPHIEETASEPFETIKFEENVATQLGDEIKSKKQGAIESIKRHPASNGKVLISYHRGLNVIYDVQAKLVDKYFYHNQVLESSSFADQSGDFFYTSHNDGSYIKWDTRQGSQPKANEDFLGQLYGPYPCKPTPKIQACTGIVNDQFEDLIVFSGGMPRATYDDKNPVTVVRVEADGKDTIKTVLDFTSKVLDFVVITRPRSQLGAGAKSSGGGGKKNKHKQQQQQRNNPIAVALAILAEEEFVVIDLLNSESYLEFALPYLNCVHSSAITCNQHYSEISDELYDQLLAYNKQQLKGKLSTNEWPITGGKVIDAPEVKTHDILLTGHEDGSVDFWDVSDLSMRHLLHLSTARFFSTNEDDLVPIDGVSNAQASDNRKNQDTVGEQQLRDGTTVANNENNLNQQDSSSAWPPLKRVGRFDPYSDDTRLAIRKLSLCPQRGTLVVAGTGGDPENERVCAFPSISPTKVPTYKHSLNFSKLLHSLITTTSPNHTPPTGQVLVLELKDEPTEMDTLIADQIVLVNDQRFTWKGREKLTVRSGGFQFEPGYQLASYVQIEPPVAATSLDLRSDWRLYALGTSYGFFLYDYANKHSVVSRCTLNVQDFAIVSGDAPGTGAMSRKKSFRKSLRESFRRLRRGRSQRNQQQLAAVGEQPSASGATKPAFGRVTTGVRALNAAPSSGPDSGNNVHRNVYSTERQVEQKVELSSIVRCITLTSAVITNNTSFKPSLWVGTNSGQVLVYAITLASELAQAKQEKVESAEQVAGEQQQGEQQQGEPTGSGSERTEARLTKEIQLKHKAPIIAIFTSPDAPPSSSVEQPAAAIEKQASELISASESSERKSEPNESLATVDGAQNESSVASERAQTPLEVQPAVEKVSPGRKDKETVSIQQPRVLICSEEQFKVFNLPNLKPFCKFKLTAHEGLRAKKISITQFLKPVSRQQQQQVRSLSASKSLQSFATQTSPPSSPLPPPAEGDEPTTTANGLKQAESNNNSLSTLNNNHHSSSSASKQQESKELMNSKFGAKSATSSSIAHQIADRDPLSEQESSSLFEPYMVCMSNQGDCAIYSVPDLKRQAQIQVCKREDINGITSTMLTNYGEGYYLKSSSNFLRFSISTQRVLRVLSVV